MAIAQVMGVRRANNTNIRRKGNQACKAFKEFM
jgi:hypothetical protein